MSKQKSPTMCQEQTRSSMMTIFKLLQNPQKIFTHLPMLETWEMKLRELKQLNQNLIANR